MKLIPVFITDLMNRFKDQESDELRKWLGKTTSFDVSYFPFVLGIDNCDGLTERMADDDINIFPIIKTSKKLSEEELDIFKVKLAFSLFPSSEFAAFINANSSVNTNWFDVTMSIMLDGQKEAVGMVSTFNDDPSEAYYAEPPVMNVPFSSLSHDYFCISRRFFYYALKNGKSNFWSMDSDCFIGKKTSASMFEHNDHLNARFFQ